MKVRTLEEAQELPSGTILVDEEGDEHIVATFEGEPAFIWLASSSGPVVNRDDSYISFPAKVVRKPFQTVSAGLTLILIPKKEPSYDE